MNRSIAILGLLMFFNHAAFNQEIMPTDEKPYQLEASYISDFGRNFSGGIKKGNVFLGMANINFSFDTQKAGWWQGGSMFVKGANLHGDSPTGELVGDFQTVSNIDAGEHTYIQEWWYNQRLGTLNITVGLQDLNAEFVAVESGANFLNSSFGIPPVVSGNIPAPIFPLTAPAIVLKWEANDKITWLASFFDGKPTDFENNRYNLNWKLCKEDGFLAISELQVNQVNFLPDVVKIGAYYHSELTEENQNTGTKEVLFDRNYGVYCIADHCLWEKQNSSKKLTAFAQVVASPEKYNTHHLYFGGGFTFSGIFGDGSGDLLGIGIAHAVFNHMESNSETVIEFNLHKDFGDNFFIQPDIQYVINPSGTDVKLDNALIGFVRMGLSF
jgi:porin